MHGWHRKEVVSHFINAFRRTELSGCCSFSPEGTCCGPFRVNRSTHLEPSHQNGAQRCAGHDSAETINSRGENLPCRRGNTRSLTTSHNEMLGHPIASAAAGSEAPAPMLPFRRAPLIPYIKHSILPYKAVVTLGTRGKRPGLTARLPSAIFIAGRCMPSHFRWRISDR